MLRYPIDAYFSAIRLCRLSAPVNAARAECAPATFSRERHDYVISGAARYRCRRHEYLLGTLSAALENMS